MAIKKRKIKEIETIECAQREKVHLCDGPENIIPITVPSQNETNNGISYTNEIAHITEFYEDESDTSAFVNVTINMANVYKKVFHSSQEEKKAIQQRWINEICSKSSLEQSNYYRFNYTRESNNIMKSCDRPIEINPDLFNVYSNCLEKEYEFEDTADPNKDYTCKEAVFYRIEIVKYLHILSSELNIDSRTLELSMVILDLYYDQCQSFDFNHSQLIASTSLLIACKFEGEFNSPKIDQLISINSTYTKRDFINMEKEILSTLNYHIPSVTTWDFIDIFLSVALEHYKNSDNFASIQSHYYSLIENVLLSTHFSFAARRFSKSSLACAIIAHVRMIIGIRPVWKKSFEQISNYCIKDFYFDLSLIQRIYNETYDYLLKKFKPSPKILLEIIISEI